MKTITKVFEKLKKRLWDGICSCEVINLYCEEGKEEFGHCDTCRLIDQAQKEIEELFDKECEEWIEYRWVVEEVKKSLLGEE